MQAVCGGPFVYSAECLLDLKFVEVQTARLQLADNVQWDRLESHCRRSLSCRHNTGCTEWVHKLASTW
eukprot:3288003-Amphidinium_carterae.3